MLKVANEKYNLTEVRISVFNLEKAVGRENRMQDVVSPSTMKKVVFTWLVKQAFFIVLGETRACVILRGSTAFLG